MGIEEEKRVSERVKDILKPKGTVTCPSCKDCTLRCPYRKHLVEQDEYATCLIPLVREKALKDKSPILMLDGETVVMYGQEVLTLMMDALRTSRNIHMAGNILDKLIKLQQAFFPATQKNINMNVEVFDKQLVEWRKTRQGLVEMDLDRAKNLAKEKSDAILAEGTDAE